MERINDVKRISDLISLAMPFHVIAQGTTSSVVSTSQPNATSQVEEDGPVRPTERVPFPTSIGTSSHQLPFYAPASGTANSRPGKDERDSVAAA